MSWCTPISLGWYEGAQTRGAAGEEMQLTYCRHCCVAEDAVRKHGWSKHRLWLLSYFVHVSDALLRPPFTDPVVALPLRLLAVPLAQVLVRECANDMDAFLVCSVLGRMPQMKEVRGRVRGVGWVSRKKSIRL